MNLQEPFCNLAGAFNMKTASGFSWETFFKIVAGNDRRRSLPQTVMPESLLEPSEGPLLEPLHEPCSPGFEGCRATGQTSKLAPGSTKVPDLQRAESSSVLELQGCRIQRRQGSKVTTLYWRFRRDVLQEFVTGSLAGTCLDAML